MHLLPTPESLLNTIDRLPDQSFIMLNLFRLREAPDYSGHPELEHHDPKSSRELLNDYIVEMDVHLAKHGAERIFLADGGSYLIGPPDERWDVVMMVRYSSKQAFIDLSSDPQVIAKVPLREVMVVDSRVMPLAELAIAAVRTT